MKAAGKWHGEVHKIGDQSVLTDYDTHIPLSGLDFEGQSGELMIYLMASCPGLFNGDEQDISCHLHENAHLFLTDTSATEIHPSGTTDPIYQRTEFRLDKKSTLEYMPDPIIPFKGTNYNGKTVIHMSEGSQALISEIVTAGRVGRKELFEYLNYTSSTEVYWNGELNAWDTVQLNPKSDLTKQGILGAFTHFATLWLLSEQVSSNHLKDIRGMLQEASEQYACYGGVSLLNKNGVVLRLVGNSSENLQGVMKLVWDYFRVAFIKLQPLEVLK